MVRFLSVAVALAAALPAVAEVSTATIDGRQISYNATPSGDTTRAVQNPLTRDDVLGMLRAARPMTPSATPPGDALEPAVSVPQRP